MNRTPRISLVVCTRNRAATLPACLDALSRMKAEARFELVLVDNGSSDNTADLLAGFASRQDIPVTVLSEPRAGVSFARNTAIQAARGSLIAFTDDDCYPAENFLQAVVDCFDDAGLAYVGGRVLLFDPADLPLTIQTSNQAADIPASSYLRPGLIQGANFAFRRDVLERIGGFDTRLGAGTRLMGAEDIDVLQRVSALGLRGRYSPELVVFHHHRRRTADDRRRILHAYAVSRGAYFAKGLTSPLTRRLYVRPVLKRLGGHIVHLRMRTLAHECAGAFRYCCLP